MLTFTYFQHFKQLWLSVGSIIKWPKKLFCGMLRAAQIYVYKAYWQHDHLNFFFLNLEKRQHILCLLALLYKRELDQQLVGVGRRHQWYCILLGLLCYRAGQIGKLCLLAKQGYEYYNSNHLPSGWIWSLIHGRIFMLNSINQVLPMMLEALGPRMDFNCSYCA